MLSLFQKKKNPRASLLPVTLFSVAYLAIATLFALGRGNWEFVFYIGVVIVLGIIAVLVHRRAHFSAGLLWALSIWGLLHMMGGLMPLPAGWPYDGAHAVLYSWWIIPGYIKYDNPIHAYGFAVSTWACWQALRAGTPSVRPTFGVLALCTLGGMGMGAANEIVEFVATLMIPGTNVGGFVNTGWDLVSNAFGCVVAAVLIGVRSRA